MKFEDQNQEIVLEFGTSLNICCDQIEDRDQE
jgi:hypothetical protein